MIVHTNTWLSIRVQNGVVRAQIHGASTNSETGLSAVEPFDVELSVDVQAYLLSVLNSSVDEAGQRILEVAYTEARTARLVAEGKVKTIVLEGGIAPIGSTN